ncbi:ABC-three component system middle component 5 [Prevotella sp.]|uniref:ABC-three component system middle component 5 n=1 Tax=Prevotella sp. TaxID=59823 RepID=UPI003DA62A0C
MITYNPAFDLYHCIYRMAHIIERFNDGECFEIDKVRIWDFYLLFPSKLYNLSLKKTEKEVREARKQLAIIKNNPYDYSGDNRKLFEWIKPFQISALNCLVSCGIINKNEYLNNRVCIASRQALNDFVNQAGHFSPSENNTLSFMSIFSRHMSLSGIDGLKARTKLLEFKYDAE